MGAVTSCPKPGFFQKLSIMPTGSSPMHRCTLYTYLLVHVSFTDAYMLSCVCPYVCTERQSCSSLSSSKQHTVLWLSIVSPVPLALCHHCAVLACRGSYTNPSNWFNGRTTEADKASEPATASRAGPSQDSRPATASRAGPSQDSRPATASRAGPSQDSRPSSRLPG